jgi:hypothetical protein
VALAATIVRVIFCGNGRAAVPNHLLANAKLSKEALDKIHGQRDRAAELEYSEIFSLLLHVALASCCCS